MLLLTLNLTISFAQASTTTRDSPTVLVGPALMEARSTGPNHSFRPWPSVATQMRWPK